MKFRCNAPTPRTSTGKMQRLHLQNYINKTPVWERDQVIKRLQLMIVTIENEGFKDDLSKRLYIQACESLLKSIDRQAAIDARNKMITKNEKPELIIKEVDYADARNRSLERAKTSDSDNS